MKGMTNRSQFRARWGVILLCWIVIGFFIAGRNIVSSVSRGARIAWDEGVLFEIIYYLIWGLLTPVIFWFARRYPLQHAPRKIHRARNALALFGFGLLMTPLHLMVDFRVNTLIAHYAFHVSPERIRQVFNSLPRIMLVESFSGLITYALIVGAFYALDYYQKFQERELKAAQLEGRLAQAELQNLKAQLQPHFLFNTLHAISVLMQENVQAANRMLVRLSELLRMALDTAGAQEVTLKQEVEFAQRYLEIEQTRFQDRLSVKIEIDPAALDARAPSLLLQPLVENAVRHGIARRAGAGLLEIRAQREGDNLRLQVRDNGPGLQTGASGEMVKGVGLSNTRARLDQLYGTELTSSRRYRKNLDAILAQ
jgi:signal transduction histidine kinase